MTEVVQHGSLCAECAGHLRERVTRLDPTSRQLQHGYVRDAAYRGSRGAVFRGSGGSVQCAEPSDLSESWHNAVESKFRSGALGERSANFAIRFKVCFLTGLRPRLPAKRLLRHRGGSGCGVHGRCPAIRGANPGRPHRASQTSRSSAP